MTAAKMPAGDAEHDGEEHGAEGELDRRREAGQELVEHRRLGGERDAEIAVTGRCRDSSRYWRQIGRSKPNWCISSAWRSGDRPRSPASTSTGSPGSMRTKPKARMVIPMKVGMIRASLPRMKRSIAAKQGGALRGAAARFATLFGDVDAVEAMNAERIHGEAGHRSCCIGMNTLEWASVAHGAWSLKMTWACS